MSWATVRCGCRPANASMDPIHLRLIRRQCARHRQRGTALLSIVVLVTLVSTYAISDAITRITSEVKVERDKRSTDAMQEAKAALIAWSASQAWTSNSNDQPGSLPCPDITNDGVSDYVGNACASQVGRLPWNTLKIADLRDASGEVLWYALSANFRKYSGVTVVNSDTQGQLTLYSDQASTTTAVLSNLVAVLLAPGQAVSGQTRSPTNSVELNDVANYLEGRNAGVTGNYTDTPQSPATYPDSFNDRVLPITHADLFSVVEPAVAARIERDIKPYINTYFTNWGAFPFPSVFATPTPPVGSPGHPGTSGVGTNRAQSAFLGGITATSGGLLPVTNAVVTSWDATTATVTLTGGIAASITGVSCTTFTTAVTEYLRCDFNINPAISGACGGGSQSYCMLNPSFAVNGPVSNVGLGFVDLPDVTGVTLVDPTSSTLTARPMRSTTMSASVASSGLGTVRFAATYNRNNRSSSARAMRVTIPGVTASAMTNSAGVTAGWFISNEWYRQLYYAVSPVYLPGGGASCFVLPGTPSCLTVNGLTTTPINNKRAILILAGRSLNGSARPSSSLANYFEGENTTPADFIFAHRSGVATSTNDRVIVVAP